VPVTTGGGEVGEDLADHVRKVPLLERVPPRFRLVRVEEHANEDVYRATVVAIALAHAHAIEEDVAEDVAGRHDGQRGVRLAHTTVMQDTE
jgi:hypothetical protein